MNAIVSYVRGSLEELKLVRWPTQQQAIRLTLITIAFILITSVVFGLIDALLTEVVTTTIQ